MVPESSKWSMPFSVAQHGGVRVVVCEHTAHAGVLVPTAGDADTEREKERLS